jgi:hypothetical protein
MKKVEAIKSAADLVSLIAREDLSDEQWSQVIDVLNGVYMAIRCAHNGRSRFAKFMKMAKDSISVEE